MDSVIVDEQGGHLGRVLRSIVNGGRSQNHGYDPSEIQKEVEELYKAGEARLGTDESLFIKVLCARSFSQLNAICCTYKEIYKTGKNKIN